MTLKMTNLQYMVSLLKKLYSVSFLILKSAETSLIKIVSNSWAEQQVAVI